jgi:hypothetical protein
LAPCRFLERYQFSISYQQLKAYRAILRCRTSALGGHIEVCHGCGFETGIPITHAARAAIPSPKRMHANYGSRHGNGIYS